MSEPTLHGMERGLAALTAWEGPPPHLWKRALAGHPGPRLWEAVQRLLAFPLPRPVMAGAAVVSLGVVVTLAVLLPLGEVPGPSRTARAVPSAAPASEDPARMIFGKSFEMPRRREAGLSPTSPREADASPRWEGGELSGFMATGGVQPASIAADRQVVRKATIELVTPDVRAAFLKAAHLVSEASGEYVQESSLTGEGESAAANLTLRVAADRLSAVLGGLRDLGAVQAETSTGEDVTEQVVDLEARIRNEQAAERELLELMQSRPDAPLKDILELRTTIAGVRESIERLAAQRERLGRLVSLATVLVIIRADPEAGSGRESSLLKYFGASIAASWDRGLRFLADTAAGLVRILVGGAIWWALAAGLLVWARRRAVAAGNRRAPGPAGA